MWQDIIVWIIVIVAAYYAIAHIIRTIRGRRACDLDQCANCPFGDSCTSPEKRNPTNHGPGCGCNGGRN